LEKRIVLIKEKRKREKRGCMHDEERKICTRERRELNSPSPWLLAFVLDTDRKVSMVKRGW